MPADVRAAVEDELGSPVAAAVSQKGGFSPGVAARVRCANGDRSFVKAVSTDPNPESPLLHRREARIAAATSGFRAGARTACSYDDGEWVVLVFDDIDGRSPTLPWQPDELTPVLYARLRPGARADAVADRGRADGRVASNRRFTAGGIFADDRRAASSSCRRVGDRGSTSSSGLEEQWPAAVEGETLLHLDTRADNLLLTDDRVYVVDWPWAAVGAPWVDLAPFLPSVAMQGGPDPEEIWDVHPLARGVDGERVDAFLAAFAGMLTWQSMQPTVARPADVARVPSRPGRDRVRVARATAARWT